MLDSQPRTSCSCTGEQVASSTVHARLKQENKPENTEDPVVTYWMFSQTSIGSPSDESYHPDKHSPPYQYRHDFSGFGYFRFPGVRAGHPSVKIRREVVGAVTGTKGTHAKYRRFTNSVCLDRFEIDTHFHTHSHTHRDLPLPSRHIAAQYRRGVNRG